MGFASLVAGAVLVLLLGVVLVLLLRARSESRRDLAAAQTETAELSSRLDALTERLEEASSAMVTRDEAAFVITDAGAGPEATPTVPDSVVLTATLGEPLVKLVAFGHGIRRALSAESRNRIWFEMRREVRASRKRRRREVREHLRRTRAAERADTTSDGSADGGTEAA
jgi:hypothetical protein